VICFLNCFTAAEDLPSISFIYVCHCFTDMLARELCLAFVNLASLRFLTVGRSQTLNQADALEKLRNAIRTALEPPKPTFTAEELEKIR
jgi:hypothetical protein